MSRREKRKEAKKLKRRQLRREAALLEGCEGHEEARIPEDDEERQKAEHDEQERLWLLREEEARVEWLRRQEEEAERKRQEEERSRKGVDGEEDLEEGWEYVEDGPAEIIWKGNEIIVKKARKKVRKGTNSAVLAVEEKNGPTGEYSNPLPPQSTSFSSYQANTQDVADQSTNFGTEQDKTNCPFYIKQGVCRFGVRCSRLHPLFNDARTLLMRSMYTGAGLALEPVESLEYTDEEVVQEYEEFYDDVHSEFLQFGEIENFKVCRNSSPHLRGNVYVHYGTRESAVAAYNHMNGRFYAKKQISCEFVGVTRWKLAICGEFMRTNYKTCSRGTACNFLHCFENPRREYEWADVDRAPPRFWRRKMATLFGYAPLSGDDFEEKPRTHIESYLDNESRRHRDDRELIYDDDRRKYKYPRETDQGRGRGDRDQKSYEDETKDRIRSGLKSRHSKEGSSRRDSTREEDGHHSHRRRRGSTHDEDSHHSHWQRTDSTHDRDGQHSHRRKRDSTHEEGDHHSHRRRRDFDDPARDKSTSCSRYGDDQGSINDERWSPGNDRELSYSKDRRRGRRQREPTHDEDDEDTDYDHHSLRRSHHHRSRRRSRSPGSPKTRTWSRSTSQKARSQDGYSSSDEQEYLRPYVKESKRHRLGSHTSIDGREDADGQRHQKRGSSDRERSESEHRQCVRFLESDDLEPVVATLVSDENRPRELETGSVFRAGENLTQEAATSSNSTLTGLSLELSSTDEVQKSTSQWQSWRKTKAKKAKLGLKDAVMRIII